MSRKNIKIQWLTKSPSMQQYVNGDQSVSLSGGRLYEVQAMDVLRDNYQVSINPYYVKNENALKYFIKSHRATIDADVCIIDPYVLAFGKFDRSKKNIAIIHHIDEKLVDYNAFGKLFLDRIISNLKYMDLVVVVSEFWKSYLAHKGIANIEVVYNAYDLEHFKFENSKFKAFQSGFQLDDKKPIIYLGKSGSGKGVEEVLDYIDASKYNLVVTGKKKHQSEVIKTRFFSETEFPMFLYMCDVVLSMSTMQEGWNRIAHESLLVKTPVVGSGSGGMRELLESSKQIIVTDWTQLDTSIQECIQNNGRYGELGFDFVKQFDLHYFKSKWIELIEKVI